MKWGGDAGNIPPRGQPPTVEAEVTAEAQFNFSLPLALPPPIENAPVETAPLVNAPVVLPFIPQQAERDDQLIHMWLRSARVKSDRTREVYGRDSARFLGYIGKPLRSVTIGDVQGFADTLLHLAPATQNRILAAVKSLFSFAHKIGYVVFNVGVAIGMQPRKDTLAERILTAEQVIAMLTLEPKPRNRALLRLAYCAGLRVSEVVGLSWRDLQERDGGEGQATVYGKGGKTRVALISPTTWCELLALKGEAGPDDPVFVSRKDKGRLRVRQVQVVVKNAAKRA